MTTLDDLSMRLSKGSRTLGFFPPSLIDPSYHGQDAEVPGITVWVCGTYQCLHGTYSISGTKSGAESSSIESKTL